MLKLCPGMGRLLQRVLYSPEKSLVALKINCKENCIKCGLRTMIPSQAGRPFHAGEVLGKEDGRRAVKVPKPDDGTEGEASIGLDYRLSDSTFPDENTPNILVDGVKFSDLPICSVRVSKNNTVFSISTSQGLVKMIRSCGMEGFKNTKKGTNVAAQATGIAMAVRALNKGYKNVRVLIRGLGPGRMSSVKGLQLGGLNIVSLTDATPVTWNCYRPRKARRL
ncbi:28S ribosomal protein S11, mitochondrial-like [Pollicipes pollicipes]|uniref:28S ribosomal protein S11, mitochondrial-like n=1 Tax=Pollicipes pollicipes TaxID=41117 RepID=UPI0018856CDB|nr:28S ribosomal protein S11, mitochondrial-like [Pollicipes pollicipes]